MTDTEQGWMQRAAERIAGVGCCVPEISIESIIREEYAKERAERVEKLKRLRQDVFNFCGEMLVKLDALIAEEEK
jgi:hypothetical protein